MSILIFFQRRILLLSAFALGLMAGLSTATAQPDTMTDISAKFKAYTDYYFQEKVYLHHDKDSYMAGETIWLKAYRVDASTHVPFFYSGVIYVELRDPENKLVRRMEVVRTDSCFMANYAIPANWPSGYYELIAYTNWMQNFDEDFYFRKKIYIYNPNDDVVNVDITYTPNQRKDRISVDALLTSDNFHVYKNKLLEIETYSNGNLLERFSRSTDKDGRLKLELKAADAITGLSLAFEDKKPVAYKRFFKVPIFDDAIDVQFMPEGGHLLADVPQRIAFKAVGADGKSVDLKGTVSDDLGNKIADIATTHLGMGQFTMSAKEGRRYTARLVSADGRQVDVELPRAVKDGLSLSASISGNALVCQVIATPWYNLKDMYIGIQARGKVVYWEKLTYAATVKIPLADLPDGIVHCFVADGQGRIFSERLVLVNRYNMIPEVKITGLEKNYGPRQLVDIDLDVTVANIPLPADLSVSVIDTKLTTVDKNDNIVSNLLLTSDIKGRVENPAYYFDKSLPAADRARNADLLMMTQAWRRFDIGGVIRTEKPVLDYTMELGQSISGNITRSFGKQAKDGKLTLIGTYKEPGSNASNVSLFREIEADDNGDFVFNDISFRDKTMFLIKGLQKDNRKNVAITIDPQRFRDIPFTDKDRTVQLKRPDGLVETVAVAPESDSPENFYKGAGLSYYYVNGEKVYVLAEAKVTGYKKGSDWGELQLDDDADYVVTLDDMLENRQYSVRDWLRSIPGVEIRNYDDPNQDRTLRINQTPAPYQYKVLPSDQGTISGGYESIYYNGRRVSVNERRERGIIHDELLDLPLSALKKIWFDLSNANDTRSFYPVLTFETKNLTGLASVRRDKLSMFEFVHMGYSVPDTFYSPKYDGTDKAKGYDERVTVYWNPCVVVGEDGKATLSFYTTDSSTKYRMVIQGVGINGMPIYKEVEFTNGGYKE